MTEVRQGHRASQGVRDALDTFDVDRPHLLALAFRLLGTLEEAEDAVQETYLRWYRLSDAERGAVENLEGWLTRVASRVCLDVLKSARARREQYVGEWLPEPLPPAFFGTASPTDPAERVASDDTIGMALLVVFEAMTPAERVAFVLHDVFAVPFGEIAEVVGRSAAAARQLAASARRRVAEHRRVVARAEEHDAVVRAFAAATDGGSVTALLELLDPSVTLRADGGGSVSAARKPVVGGDRVARFMVGIMTKRPTRTVTPCATADGVGLVLRDADDLQAVADVRVVDGLITDVWIVLNPAKLAGWRARRLAP